MLNDEQIKEIGLKYGVETAVIKSVMATESGGNGLINGKPKILFEGHIFWRELIKVGIDPKKILKGNEDILYQKWTKKYYNENQYLRLEKAERIDKICALKSTSFGLFQILGENYKLAGYTDVNSFVNSMSSEANQLLAFLIFLKNSNNLINLQQKKFTKFALKYNGKDYKSNNYDKKLMYWYKRYK